MYGHVGTVSEFRDQNIVSMRLIASCLVLIGVLACAESASDTSNVNTGASVPSTTADTEPQLVAAPLQEQLAFSATESKPTTNEALILRLATVEATEGSEVCLPMQVQGFKNLIGLQYTLRWDTTQLAFQSVGDFQLPGLREGSFGLRFAERGVIATSWIDDRLDGVTIADGTAIYEVCYRVLAPSGTEAVVRIANKPVSFEVIDAREQLLRLRYADGRVKVR